MKFVLIFVSLLVLSTLSLAKKQATQKVKVVYVEKAPPKPPSEYELCKQECRIQRDAQSNQERVEQLKQELKEAEALLAEHNKHVDAPEIPEERRVSPEGVEVVQTHRKASRYDHLKMAASKIVGAGSDLGHVVTGGDTN